MTLISKREYIFTFLNSQHIFHCHQCMYMHTNHILIFKTQQNKSISKRSHQHSPAFCFLPMSCEFHAKTFSSSFIYDFSILLYFFGFFFFFVFQRSYFCTSDHVISASLINHKFIRANISLGQQTNS